MATPLSVLTMMRGMGMTGAAEALRKYRAERKAHKQARAFVEQFARLTPYAWAAIDGYTDDQSSDAITTVNDLIVRAREIAGFKPLTDACIGEQEPDTIYTCQGCGLRTSNADMEQCENCGGEDFHTEEH